MAFWSGATLESRLPSLVTTYNLSSVDCNAYTLHMGRQYYLSADGSDGSLIEELKEGKSLSIPSGQFAFLLTDEVVEIPTSVIAFISMKTEIKFRGLVNVSGFHVDPGFKGPLKFAVYNAGPKPILIKQGDPCFLIWYADLDNVEDSVHAKKPSDNEKYKGGITSRDVQAIAGAVPSLVVLSQKVDDLEKAQLWMKVTLYAFGFVAAVVIATVTFLTHEGLKSFLKQAGHWLQP